jgi:hypothetical protein
VRRLSHGTKEYDSFTVQAHVHVLGVRESFTISIEQVPHLPESGGKFVGDFHRRRRCIVEL